MKLYNGGKMRNRLNGNLIQLINQVDINYAIAKGCRAMIDYDDLKKQKKAAVHDVKSNLTKMRMYTRDINRLDNIISDSQNIIDSLDYKFESLTGLNKTDIIFLFSATALQMVRQYCLRFSERTGHLEAGEEAHKKEQAIFNKYFEKNDKSERFYYASMTDILTKGVPYDVVKGSKKYSLGGEVDKGLTGNTHRIKTLGHDPVLGYIFGTANIMTATLTTNNLVTVHVKNSEVVNRGNTSLMFEHAAERCKTDPEALCASFVKQYFHIKSDELSKKGIPLPVISMTHEDLMSELMGMGIDYANVLTVGKQASLAIVINMVINYLYCLINIKSGNKEIVKVKAKKIIEYSNIIASSSNIIGTMITQDLKKLDVGGILVTIYSIIESKKLQQQLKEEFIINEFCKLIES